MANAGKVNATELVDLFEQLGQPITYEKLTKVMKQHDVDEDGTISFWEWLRMFKHQLLDLKSVLEYIELNPTLAALSSHKSQGADIQVRRAIVAHRSLCITKILQVHRSH